MESPTFKSGTLLRLRDLKNETHSQHGIWLQVGEEEVLLLPEGGIVPGENLPKEKLEPICITYLVWEEIRDLAMLQEKLTSGLFEQAFASLSKPGPLS